MRRFPVNLMEARRSMTRFHAWFLIAVVAVLSLGAAPPDWRKPGKDWGKGPVRWILTDEEEKQFKSLKTDDERAAFVKAFWEKRDPTPGTPANEFEMIYWKRVEEAEKRFQSKTNHDPGWLTDRGRTFLLLGPPTKIEADARNRSIWLYEVSPVTGIKEAMSLMFAPGTSLLLDRKTLEKYVAAHPETTGIGWTLPEAPEEKLQMAAAPRNPEEDLSPESKRQIAVLQEILARGAGPTGVPFQVNLDFYAAVDGSTLTVMTVETPREAAHGADDSALKAFARFAPVDDGAPMNVTGPLPFVPASAADAPAATFVYQARRNLKPGKYTMAVVVEDKIVPGQSGSLVQPIDIPDFSAGTFAMSNIALLAKFGPIEAGLGPEGTETAVGPFIMGSFRLVPRAYNIVTPKEALAFYYQVYNPSSDPATGKPSLEITYAFFLKDGQAWKPFRKPVVKQQRGQVELFAVDMKDLLLPNQVLPAEFRMEAKIVDAVTKQELKRELLFSVR